MKTYSEKLKDPRWQKMRLSILNRDSFACRDCGDTKEELHVHHCFYQKGNPWDTDRKFLLSLCKTCHDRRGSAESKTREMIGLILSKCSIESAESIAEQLAEVIQSKAFLVYPDLSILDSAEMAYQADMRWFYDLTEVTGDESVYNAIKTKRNLEEGGA